MTRLHRHPDAVATALEGEAFLVRRDHDAILRLNPTAAALWRVLAEPAGRDELVQTFVAAFPEVAAGRLEADLDAAVGALLADGMVVETDD